jgi:hypothetical protein
MRGQPPDESRFYVNSKSNSVPTEKRGDFNKVNEHTLSIGVKNIFMVILLASVDFQGVRWVSLALLGITETHEKIEISHAHNSNFRYYTCSRKRARLYARRI